MIGRSPEDPGLPVSDTGGAFSFGGGALDFATFGTDASPGLGFVLVYQSLSGISVSRCSKIAAVLGCVREILSCKLQVEVALSQNGYGNDDDVDGCMWGYSGFSESRFDS